MTARAEGMLTRDDEVPTMRGQRYDLLTLSADEAHSRCMDLMSMRIRQVQIVTQDAAKAVRTVYGPSGCFLVPDIFVFKDCSIHRYFIT